MTRPQVASRSEVARGLRASVCAAMPRRGSLLYSMSKLITIVAVSASAILPMAAHADSLVAPVAATAQSHYGDRAPGNTIDGSGMSENPVTVRSSANNTASLMWLSNGTSDTWIMFDMGETMTLTGMHVWNYNEDPFRNKKTGRIEYNFPQRGVKTCELRVGDSPLADGATYAAAGEWGTLKENISLACAIGDASGYEGEDVRFGVPLTTRYVMLRVLANHNHEVGNPQVGNYTGLSEVRFYRIGLPVSPVAATVQSHYRGSGADDRRASNTIDGSGMSPLSLPRTIGVTADTRVDIPTMWLSNGTTDTWIAFDLGAVKTVTGFHLWNYNESGPNFPKRGIKKAEVYVGETMPPEGGSYANAGAAWGRLVETMEFAQAPGVAGYLGEDYQFQTPVIGRYFQFVVKEKHDSSDRYTGISEILFYEAAQETTVTRLSSGAETIPDGTVVAVVTDGEGVAAPIAVTDGARVRAIRAEASGGMPQIDPNGGTLAVGTIDLPAGSAGLEIMPGNVTGLAEMRSWLEWRLDSDLVVHADLSGAVNLWKTGPGTLVFDGSDTRTGDNWFSGGVFRQTGGSLDIPGGTFVDAKAEFLGGTSRATGTDGFALCGSSMMVVEDHSAEWSKLQAVSGVTALAVRDGATLTLGSLAGDAPESFNIAIDDGTIGPRALITTVPWLPNLGPVRVGAGGAVFDTSAGDAVVEAVIEGDAGGGAITKTGANTLELRRRVANAGPVHIEEGTLRLALPQAVVRYDFEGIDGTKVPNLGSGGAAYDGVVSGAPEQVDGLGGTGKALSFCAATNGVATASALGLRDYTYATWVKSAGVPAARASHRIIIGGNFADKANFIGYLGTDAPTGIPRSGIYWAFVRDADQNLRSDISSVNDTENWHHIASTFDGSTVTLYYDGNLVYSLPAQYARQLYNVKVGFGNNVSPNNEFWHGAMDDACVFDRALSADEIAMLMRGEWKAVNVLNPESDLSIDEGAKLDLGGTDQTVATLTLKGRLRRLGPTTWGAIGSGADHETDLIVGEGVLRVTGPARSGLSVIVK